VLRLVAGRKTNNVGFNIGVLAENTKAIHAYLNQLQFSDLSPLTISKYAQCLRCYEQWLQDDYISEKSAKAFLDFLQTKNFSRPTRQIYYHALRPFLQKLNITLNMRKDFRKKVKRTPKYHKPREIQLILKCAKRRADKWGKLAPRDFLILLTLAHTGFRRKELLSLTPSDINFEERMITIIGKEDKQRTIPITDELYRPLLDYTKKLKTSERIFPLSESRIDALVKRYAREAGINDITPHSFRHYFITQVIMNASDPSGIKIAQQLAGHASIETTSIYLDIIPKHLTDAVQRLPKLTEEK